MAEASCSGPSPFKRLVDHQSRDVSHHQDRLIDRSAGQAHGSFRSHHQTPQNTDHNFDAFLQGTTAAAAALPPGVSHDPANRLAIHAAALHQPAHHHDFSQHTSTSPPMVLRDTANWAADFARFSGHQIRSPPTATATVGGRPAFQPFQSITPFQPFTGGHPASSLAAPYAMSTGLSAGPGSDFDRQMSQWASIHGSSNTINHAGGDMAAVDARLALVAAELEAEAEAANYSAAAQQDQQNSRSAQSDQDIAVGLEDVEAAAAAVHHLTDLQASEIGNLSLEEASASKEQQAEEEESIAAAAAAARDREKSAVSEAAERLLESVRHEDGEKWQNSTFLSLMRDFRDGRKDIVNNEICATQTDGEGNAPHQAEQQQQQQQQSRR